MNRENPKMQALMEEFVNKNVLGNITELVKYALNTQHCLNSSKIIIKEQDCHNMYDEKDEPIEIFSWYLVTPLLATKPLEHGEPIIIHQNQYIWGRTEFNQPIYMDYIMWDIAQDYKIV